MMSIPAGISKTKITFMLALSLSLDIRIKGAESGQRDTPPLKNGNELRAAGYLVAVGSRTARFRRKHKNKIPGVTLLALLFILFCLFVTMTVLYVRVRKHRGVLLCETRECLRSAANLALSMDRTADPCNDFYQKRRKDAITSWMYFPQYSCGNWAEEHPRPDSLSSYDWFREKQMRVYSLVREVLTRNQTETSLPLQQAKEVYLACMDTETLDKVGLQPAIQVLETVGLPAYPAHINVTEEDQSSFKLDWIDVAIRAKIQLGMDLLIGFDIFTDPKNSSRYRLVMGSPETTNPFPSMHNDKKRHSGRRYLKTHPDTSDKIFIDIKQRGHDHDPEKEQRMAKALKTYYAELIKLFFLETPDSNTTKLTETELDQNIIEATNEFYALDSALYDLETDNETESDEDIYANIPEYTAVELEAATGVNSGEWGRYLTGVFNISSVQLDWAMDTILVSEPDKKYLQKMYELISMTPPLTIQLYMWMKVVEVMAVHTNSEVRTLAMQARQAARGRNSSGASEPARSLLCADVANDMMGLAIASAIVDPHFLNVTKPKIEQMLHEMKNALSRLVGRTKWMDDDTKLATYQKIIKMRSLVGFPDWLLEEGRLEEYYMGIKVSPTTHLQNMVNIIQVKIRKALNKFRVGNNVTWATDPTEVNAYHTFQENTIKLNNTFWPNLDAAVPLVMLQYPFFDLGLDSLNYGSLGTILGHEITHGFDNFGRQFDKNGNLIPWWSNDTVAGFLNVTRCFIDQYNEYLIPELGEYVDGKRTLGENIADAGGVREAFAALKEHLQRTGPEPKLPGFEKFTSEQLFFLSYGNLWCGVWTRSALAADARDEHAPQRIRAPASLRNAPGFAAAWHCPEGSPMHPSQERLCIVF